MIKETRSSIVQARENERNWGILSLEIIIISIVLGFTYRNWFVFGGVFIVLNIILQIKPLAAILSLLLSVGWGMFGWSIGTIFTSISASIVLCILGFLIGFSIHASALTYIQDFIRKDNNQE